MHSEEQILSSGGFPTSTAVLDQANSSIHHKECASCFNIKPYSMFTKDASYREGWKDICDYCLSRPRLSTLENYHKLKEDNYYSEATQRLRDRHTEDYIDPFARRGTPMTGNELIYRLRRLMPLFDATKNCFVDLFFSDGRIVGDIAVFKVFGKPQDDLVNELGQKLDYQYLWYVPAGSMTEFSTYDFDQRDIILREKQRGWRTPLLRLIRAKLLSEEACNREFGKPEGIASTVYQRKLFIARNGHEPSY